MTSRPRRRAAASAWVLWLATVSVCAADPAVVWQPARPRVGDVARVDVRGLSPGASVEGLVGGHDLAFFPRGDERSAVVGFDLETPAGAVPWQVVIRNPGHPVQRLEGRLHLRGRRFPVQRLALPPAMVDLDPATERRAVAEAERLLEVSRRVTPERLWRGSFLAPVDAEEPATGFGARRILNGRPRAPHTGIDFGVPVGTPVLATNGGRVALTGEFYFPGRLVVLDHGLGLHTLYFHLQRVDVNEGDRVARGQVVGIVGATGRATGPHLHFGAVVGSARVDPATLLGLEVGETDGQ